MAIKVELAKPLRLRLKDAGYAALVVVGPMGRPKPLRLQAAENVTAVLPALQAGNPHLLEIAELMWTPGMTAAKTILHRAESQLVATAMPAPHWYGAELPLVQNAMIAAANSISCPVWTHEAMLAEIRRREFAEADYFAANVCCCNTM